MTEANVISVRATVDSFRRAGLVFTKEPKTLNVSDLTAEQIAAINAEPNLVVVALHDAPADEVKLDQVRPDEEIKLDKIVALIGELDLQDQNVMTKSNKPDAGVLSEMLGENVSAQERDVAWQEFQTKQAGKAAE